LIYPLGTFVSEPAIYFLTFRSVICQGCGKVIVPVHPRRRCSITIEDDGNGNLSAVFAPCAGCLSMVFELPGRGAGDVKAEEQ
jgi:hypothetical protein